MFLPSNKSPYRSTYSATYTSSPELPPIVHYSQTPSINDAHRRHLPPREFPVIPIGPQRPLIQLIPLGPGLGTTDVHTDRLLDPKPIIKTEPKRQLHCVRSDSSEDGAMGDSKLIRDFLWTSTTRKATEEVKIPMVQVVPPSTTIEENADLVKYRPLRYEHAPESWQRVGQHWDRAQTRPRFDSMRGNQNPNPRTLLHRRNNNAKKSAVDEKIIDLSRNGKLSACFERSCPGYAGFLPRAPIEARLERPREENPHTSVMRQSYKRFPSHYAEIQQFAHKGPMSHTVTLTYPYNPFNKVEKSN